MRLRILLPTHVEIDEEVDKVSAEGLEGAFCLLPRHLDWVAGLVPSLLSYEQDGQERFLAVNGGILVKCGDEVAVSTFEAAGGTVEVLPLPVTGARATVRRQRKEQIAAETDA